MTLKEWIESMKEEWAFYKRHPEMFIPWALMLWALITAISEEIK